MLGLTLWKSIPVIGNSGKEVILSYDSSYGADENVSICQIIGKGGVLENFTQHIYYMYLPTVPSTSTFVSPDHCRILVDFSGLFYNIMPWFDEIFEIGHSIKCAFSAESLHFDNFFSIHLFK